MSDERNKELLNLTPHEVALVGVDGFRLRIPPSGTVARVEMVQEVVARDLYGNSVVEIDRIVERAEHVVGLPNDVPWRTLIVSRMVAQALPGRADLVYPTNLVRDAGGRVIGCQALGTCADIFLIEDRKV